MKVNNKHMNTIWETDDHMPDVHIIDQRQLPHQFITKKLTTLEDFFIAIRDMYVRGAPLIGVTAAYGVYIAIRQYKNSINFDSYIAKAAEYLISSRPTAVNLEWAVKEQLNCIAKYETYEEKLSTSLANARTILENDVANSKKIGAYGAEIIKQIFLEKQGKPVNILTHCNAGWLATVDYGTATAPMYIANDMDIPIHVWVDETRPRNQGAKLTAWELLNEGIDHTLIVDNLGGHLMQHGMVDLVIVGSDRTSLGGDVANKIGTYLKALAAFDNNIPFYVALPSSTIDWNIDNGIKDIPIESRDQDEVRYVEGKSVHNDLDKVLISPVGTNAANYAFDVTPRRLVTGLITERGVCRADEQSILQLFPEKQ